MYNFSKVNLKHWNVRIFAAIMSLVIFLIIGVGITSAASIIRDDIHTGPPKIRYCDGEDECGWKQGVEYTKGIKDIETVKPFSVYIQEVVLYLLSFITLVAVIYVIYAGVQILTGNGDEEKLKKSKQIIIYVAIGLSVIWLAWPITRFIYAVLIN